MNAQSIVADLSLVRLQRLAKQIGIARRLGLKAREEALLAQAQPIWDHIREQAKLKRAGE